MMISDKYVGEWRDWESKQPSRERNNLSEVSMGAGVSVQRKPNPDHTGDGRVTVPVLSAHLHNAAVTFTMISRL